MIGGVFGDITGIAPGYSLSLSYEQFEFFTQGEYFFDAGIRSGNFFYSWSELSYAPVTWFVSASSWIGPKRSGVNSTFVADRWSDSNIKKSILQRIGLVPVRRALETQMKVLTKPQLLCSLMLASRGLSFMKTIL